MMKVVAALAMFGAGSAVGLFMRGNPVEAQRGTASRRPIGDVNNDGRLNVADAVYLLNYLFGGPTGQGPAPVAGPLPATGQATCADESGNNVSCDSARCTGQDGLYQAGCSFEGRFLDNRDGTVTDICLGLMWQQSSADVLGDGSTPGDAVSWCKAMEYCENLTFAGHDDWRLPNLRELQTLVDYGREEIMSDPIFHEGNDRYWSSTYRYVRFNSASNQAWYVSMYKGEIGADTQGAQSYVRAVRSLP
jgi:hypothetical protein